MDSSSFSNNPGHLKVGLDTKTNSLPSSAYSKVEPNLAGHAIYFYGYGRQNQTIQSLTVQGNLASIKQNARLRCGVTLPTSSSEMEASTGKILDDGEREIQYAWPALMHSSPGSV